MQKVFVEVKGHEWFWELSEPTFYKTCDGVDGVVVQTRCLRTCGGKKNDTMNLQSEDNGLIVNSRKLAAIYRK